jgi:hypothetical protein
MPFWTPSIQVHKIDRVEVHGDHHPFFEKMAMSYLEEWRRHLENRPWPDPQLQLQALEQQADEGEPSRLMKVVDSAGKVVSLVAGVAVIVFVFMAITGRATVAGMQIGNLLTVFGFTLVGGLVSVGGVKLFSVNASLRRAKEQVRQTVLAAGGCPFARIVDDNAKQHYRIRSPYQIGNGEFCQRCQLIERDNRTTICTVSPLYSR